MKEPLIAPSAKKHGVLDETISAEDIDEALVMLIGPDHGVTLFEIGVVSSEEGPVIVHAMPERDKYLR